MKSLSGGESQRIRLATQIGSKLVGVLYILDEPSIGLHQRDNVRLIKALQDLRDIGNSVIVVEHDKEMILSADDPARVCELLSRSSCPLYFATVCVSASIFAAFAALVAP